MCCVCWVAQLCPTLCNPLDCSPLGSFVHGIFQAKNWSGLPFPSQGGGLIESILLIYAQSLQLCLTLCDPVNCRLLCPWVSPGKNTGVGCHALLEVLLLHCRWILHQLSHQGSPVILEWVASPFYSGSSLLRDRTGVSCIAGGFFTSWATGKPKN